jgi:hypothetical protein
MSGNLDAPELAPLRADYPGWEMWRRAVDRAYVAWHVGTRSPVMVYSLTVAGLRAQIEEKVSP